MFRSRWVPSANDSPRLNRFRSRPAMRVYGWSHRAVESAKESTWSLRNFRLHSRARCTGAPHPYIKSLIEFSAVAPARERLGSFAGPFSLSLSLSLSLFLFLCRFASLLVSSRRIVPALWSSWPFSLSTSLSDPRASLRACYSSCCTVLFSAHSRVYPDAPRSERSAALSRRFAKIRT